MMQARKNASLVLDTPLNDLLETGDIRQADAVVFPFHWRAQTLEDRRFLETLKDISNTLKIIRCSQGFEMGFPMLATWLDELDNPSKELPSIGQEEPTSVQTTETAPLGRRVYICAHGRHGKTSAAEFLSKEFGLTYSDSSKFACERAVFPTLRDKYHYKSVEECHADRHNHRAEWHELIAEYCNPPERLSYEIFATNQIYVGIRSARELAAARHLADLVIWIDASGRRPAEGEDSNKITPDMCDIIIPNNGDESEFHDRLRSVGKLLLNK